MVILTDYIRKEDLPKDALTRSRFIGSALSPFSS